MYDATNWARAQKTGSTSAKFILLLLADFAGTDYSCYPSVAKLAEIAEMGESTVRAATKLLADLGLIRVFYRHRSNGSRRSSRYQLLVDGPDTAEPDADDWADYRRIPADAMRQDAAGGPPESSGGTRRDSADIPLVDPPVVEPSPVKGRAARVERSTRVPEDFEPDEKMRAWFAAENLSAVIDGKLEHAKFMDYWRAASGANARKHDWPATWRNWMRRAAERAPRRPGNAVVPTSGAPRHYPSTTDAKVMQTLNLAEKFRQMEEDR